MVNALHKNNQAGVRPNLDKPQNVRVYNERQISKAEKVNNTIVNFIFSFVFR